MSYTRTFIAETPELATKAGKDFAKTLDMVQQPSVTPPMETADGQWRVTVVWWGFE